MSPRKTLKDGKKEAIFGTPRKRVRVLEELHRGVPRVLVIWREHGKPKKKKFDATVEGRREAIAWAKGFAETRGQSLDVARTPLTLRRLWELYAESEFESMRPASRVNYTNHWKKWEISWGAEFVAERTTLEMLIQFRRQERELGRASNQVRQTLNVVKIVYNWAALHDLIAVNKVALYKWKRAKNEKKLQPGEYSELEYERILLALDPMRGTEWRGWVICALIAQHGGRISSVLQLRWSDLTSTELTWPGEFQKNGEPLVHPVTWETHAALETARYWHRRLAIDSQWVIPGSGTRAAKPFTYSAAHHALMAAEQRAGVEHERYRAFHGGRRMVAGNILDTTGDARLAMEYIGDRDLKQMNSYLKRRDDRIERASRAVSGRDGQAPQASEPAAVAPLVEGPRQRVSRRKTHCNLGHEFTAENTITLTAGGTRCRTCQNEAKRKWKRTHRPKASPNRPPIEGEQPTNANASVSGGVGATSGMGAEPLVGFEPTTVSLSELPHSGETQPRNDLARHEHRETLPETVEDRFQTAPKASPAVPGISGTPGAE